MSKSIRIATRGVAADYHQSLVPLALRSLGFDITWTQPEKADLLIYGPFFQTQQKPYRWLPRALRPKWSAMVEKLLPTHRPLTLFQTGENLRHNHVPTDYSLSFDLAVESSKHLRMPYWMEMVDWSQEGVTGNTNPRFGTLLNIERLSQPLGNDFLKRPQRAAIFASHLREPRETLVHQVSKIVPVQGFGPAFNNDIRHHSQSDIVKIDTLKAFAFNLCPENTMNPGYYTEKIPEAFMAGCLPLTWVDSNVEVDFNPQAFINLAPMTNSRFEALNALLGSKLAMENYASHALFARPPTIAPLLGFIRRFAEEATT
jgi:Glycosyltransferase family 10 (fucosyltransferase) C-term/Alpha-(1,3)-fucosyltransferase FucT N-terminal domain